jgi:acid phosphatase family membrane protein YuiD
VGGGRDWTIPFALAVTVLVSSYAVRVKTMWRQAPITAAIVIAAGISRSSTLHGVQQGLHKVGEVLFGCVVGLLVSWLMSKVWLVRPPAQRAEQS